MMTLVMYVTFVLPIEVAWGAGLSNTDFKTPKAVLDLVDAMFIFDILFNFNSTYIDSSTQIEIWSRTRIGRRYLHNYETGPWFVTDLLSRFPTLCGRASRAAAT